MSLLEDVFLEDEAGEAQELERIIEGDDYDERPRAPNSNENSEKEDEAEEDKRRVDPTSAKTKRVVKNPRVVLNPARLTGPRGIQVIPEHFKDFKFKGKGHEKEDLDIVLKKLEHWAYRLYPKFEFKDCLKKIETLGNKRPVMVHLTKIRTDQLMSEETVVQRESSEDEAPQQEPEQDEFDKLLQHQIELARATPHTGKKGYATPGEKHQNMPKAISSPSINNEQRERMLRNRQLAEERRLARLKLNNSENGLTNTITDNQNINYLDNITNDRDKDSRGKNKTEDGRNSEDIEKGASNRNTTVNANLDEDMNDAEHTITKGKNNKSNVIDSSDSDEDGLIINESVAVDVHENVNYDSDGNSDVNHRNEHKNIRTVCQNENDKGINSNIDLHNEDSNSDHQNDNEQSLPEIDRRRENGGEGDSDNHQNANDDVEKNINDHENQYKNNCNVFRIDKDVEMNDNNSLTELTSDKNKQPIHDKVDNAKENEIDIQEMNKNKVDLNTLEFNGSATVVSNQINEDVNNLKDVADGSTKKADAIDRNDETTTGVDDIMDVDFSEDF